MLRERSKQRWSGAEINVLSRMMAMRPLYPGTRTAAQREPAVAHRQDGEHLRAARLKVWRQGRGAHDRAQCMGMGRASDTIPGIHPSPRPEASLHSPRPDTCERPARRQHRQVAAPPPCTPWRRAKGSRCIRHSGQIGGGGKPRTAAPRRDRGWRRWCASCERRWLRTASTACRLSYRRCARPRHKPAGWRRCSRNSPLASPSRRDRRARARRGSQEREEQAWSLRRAHEMLRQRARAFFATLPSSSRSGSRPH